MKIKFKFNDGTINEVEVDDEYGKKYLEEEKKFENDERKYRYWVKQSLDEAKYEGDWFASNELSPEEKLLRKEEERSVAAFKRTLTTIQLRRLELLENGLSEREIARLENVDHKAVIKTIKQLQVKFLKYFKE